MKYDKHHICLQLKILRIQNGYSQMELSVKLNMSQNAYSELECGKRKIDIERLFQIAELFDVDIRWFLLHSPYK
jgi:transcriptional regulator with XRE-family HTH domain